jgi:hypothetical protein
MYGFPLAASAQTLTPPAAICLIGTPPLTFTFLNACPEANWMEATPAMAASIKGANVFIPPFIRSSVLQVVAPMNAADPTPQGIEIGSHDAVVRVL